MAEDRFEVRPVGPYSLAASARFLEGFAPAAYEGGSGDLLRFAFVADGFEVGDERVAGVRVLSEGDSVVGEVFGGADVEVVRSQVARILSLDIDGSGFSEVGERDPVIGRLQAGRSGLRPVCFYSPYEAAAWAIIGNRIRIVQAARIKARMARELGPSVKIRGEEEHAFPGPTRLMRLEEFPSLSGRKVEYLRRLACKALEGNLDASYLRSVPVERALKELKELPGIGDFSAELILLRGTGEPDHLPVHKPRLGRAVALAYGLEHPPEIRELAEISETWRPYRAWVSFLLRVALEEETREISGGGGRAMARVPQATK